MSFDQINFSQSKDADIRGPLISWLTSKHPYDGSTGIVQELEIPRPSARIDVAVVNGEIAGFEIKSDADTLFRLRTQIPAFSLYFDKVNLVTTKKHLKNARRTVPEWWGIIIFNTDRSFRIVRQSKKNKNKDLSSVLHSLSKTEMTQLLTLFNKSYRKSSKKSDLVKICLEIQETDTLSENIRAALRKRRNTLILLDS